MSTVSPQLLHPPGVAALARWGLLASGCPPIDTYAFDLGPFTGPGARPGPGRLRPPAHGAG